MSGWHHVDGVFIASGGPIRRHVTPAPQPSVTDITPTILALMGLPVGRDMPGRVLEEIIDPEFLAAHPVQYVDSYEEHIDRERLAGTIDESEERQLEYLRSLGYIK